MIYRILFKFSLILLIAGCCVGLSPIEDDSAKYKQDKDHKSLEVIFKSLSKGMKRKEVERLLGDPDYSPIKGQYYYSTDKSVYSKVQERKVPFGLVIDYRDTNGLITKTLRNFWMGPIGE